MEKYMPGVKWAATCGDVETSPSGRDWLRGKVLEHNIGFLSRCHRAPLGFVFASLVPPAIDEFHDSTEQGGRQHPEFRHRISSF